VSAPRAVPARLATVVVLAALVPLLVQAGLVAWLGAHGGATLMLGAASGSTGAGIVVMATALALRVYSIVALPGLAVAWLVARPWRRDVTVTERRGILRGGCRAARLRRRA
jgi:hypothetical protein